MSKKILTALAPVAAIVAFMALPALAQATQAQCGASECANGATIRGQSTNLKTQVQNEQGAEKKDEGALECTSSTFQGSLNTNQVETLEGSVVLDTLGGCTAKGISADVWTNASTEMEREQRTMAEEQEQKKDGPWTLKVQQPEGNGPGETEGQVTGHITGGPQGLRFTVQVQVFGFSVATCTYEAKTIQVMGTAQSDTMSIMGSQQFMLVESNSSECGVINVTTGDLTGSFQLETDVASNPQAVVVHMS